MTKSMFNSSFSQAGMFISVAFSMVAGPHFRQLSINAQAGPFGRVKKRERERTVDVPSAPTTVPLANVLKNSGQTENSIKVSNGDREEDNPMPIVAIRGKERKKSYKQELAKLAEKATAQAFVDAKDDAEWQKANYPFAKKWTKGDPCPLPSTSAEKRSEGSVARRELKRLKLEHRDNPNDSDFQRAETDGRKAYLAAPKWRDFEWNGSKRSRRQVRSTRWDHLFTKVE